MKLRAPVAALAAALCLLSTVLPAQQSAAPPYTVVTREARRPLATRTIAGQEMFALDDLARLFSLTVREDAAAGGLMVTAGAQTIVLSTQQPLASVSGRMISLPAAPVRDGRLWYVPVDFVSRALASILPGGVELRKPSRLVLAGGVRLPRIAARSDAIGAGTTRITIDVAPPTPHTVTQEPTRILVRFDADALDLGDIRIAPGDTVTAVHQGDAGTVLAIDLGPRFGSFRASDQPAPTPGSARIFVELLAQTDAPAPGVPLPGTPVPIPAPDAPPLLDLPTPGGLRAIVIDAGHGGDDTGAKGAQGTLEKNVTLGVARRLKGALEARLGVRVLLTREGDQAVASDQRAALANNNKADLFISLHANASLRPAVAGAQVFYLNLEGYGDVAQRAAQATADALPVLGGGSREIEITPWEMAQARHLDQSAAFARSIEAALRARVPMSARALQQAPFRVLVGANMPAVLVELGFLTNAAQEKQLIGDEHQNTLVQALVEGIVRYRAATGAGGTR
ncbi:MAG TPA: N-acetylmuramoyl-L-alanine amidase [Vicinamibacterales bacterium]|nr:N-acetylmuramoyl-L-alanine amidase [Vicinamibacterales bacterium]